MIIYGRNAVMEALLSGRVPETLYVKRDAGGLDKHVAIARDMGAVVKDVDENRLNSLLSLKSVNGGNESKEDRKFNLKDVNIRHGGIAAEFGEVSYYELDELIAVSVAKNTPPFLVIADGIEDPRNLGALIRTAEAAGADGLIIPKRRNAGLTAAVYNASAGAANWLKVCRVSNIVDTIGKLKRSGVWIYGAEADGQPFYETKFDGGVALVIGSEGKGLGRLVRESCDFVVSVDMYGKINSLNASVCGGILMYEIVRYRRGKKNG